MRILIAGIDGYLGWPLAQYLLGRGHDVAGADAFLRRKWVEEMGSVSAIPIADAQDRFSALPRLTFYEGDLMDFEFVLHFFEEFQPEAIVHLGECPSAPYSMVDIGKAAWVQTNNVVTTLNILFAMKSVCPEAHLVKLGTMGEYGTPNLDIPEGYFEVEYRGRVDTLPFPRQAGSFYHLSKVFDSQNIEFVCRIWGLRSTDIMQGVVFGTYLDEMGDDPRLRTRLDFDEAFGTVINRYCCQAVIGHTLTPFGLGGQTRGFIPLRDSVQCMTLAVENPPEKGEYRVLNQFAELFSVEQLADKVAAAANSMGLSITVDHIQNPRIEAEEHYYNPDHQRLFDLGYQPSSIEDELVIMLSDLLPHQGRIKQYEHVLKPRIRWNGTRS
jgi:UDP-sulfoquinovose synthase